MCFWICFCIGILNMCIFSLRFLTHEFVAVPGLVSRVFGSHTSCLVMLNNFRNVIHVLLIIDNLEAKMDKYLFVARWSPQLSHHHRSHGWIYWHHNIPFEITCSLCFFLLLNKMCWTFVQCFVLSLIFFRNQHCCPFSLDPGLIIAWPKSMIGWLTDLFKTPMVVWLWLMMMNTPKL